MNAERPTESVEELRDVICFLLSQSEDGWIGRTKLNKLIYFAELESWRTRGKPLTHTQFYRWHYGAYAPDIEAVAEYVPALIEHRHIMRIYRTHEYRLRDRELRPLSPEAAQILAAVFARYHTCSAAELGRLSKQTEPMLLETEPGKALDLTVVAPPRPAIRIRHSGLAEAQSRLDKSVRGTREEIDARDEAEVAAWRSVRRQAV